MTRTRKSPAGSVFRGAGPGDPGLLPGLRTTPSRGDHVVFFPVSLPESMRTSIRLITPEQARFISPGRGRTGDVAKVFFFFWLRLSAARSGLHSVHLVSPPPAILRHESWS